MESTEKGGFETKAKYKTKQKQVMSMIIAAMWANKKKRKNAAGTAETGSERCRSGSRKSQL